MGKKKQKMSWHENSISTYALNYKKLSDDYNNLRSLYNGRRQEICDLQSAYSELEEDLIRIVNAHNEVAELNKRRIKALESANANLIQAMSNINYANNL